MIRLLLIGALSLSLPACAARYHPIDPTARPADLPDAALVAPCDTSDRDPPTNGDLSDELARTRHQRNDCAVQVDGLGQWRVDAAKRANDLLN